MIIEVITKISNNTFITRIYNYRLKKVQKHDDPSSRIIHLNRDELNTILQELKRYNVYSRNELPDIKDVCGDKVDYRT